MLVSRSLHYIVLTLVVAFVTLPNLGATSLWDVDEGVNAGCTREMMESGTWVVPTFNWELRTAKPVMLYWLQRLSFETFGISEWSARIPAVICAVLTVLLTYEIGRRMFTTAIALLGGIVLATAIEFCKLAHAATPDAPLLLFTTLTFYFFWIGHENGRRSWFSLCGFASGLAMLTKGPVGLLLPGLVVFLYFLWNRELRRFVDHLLLRGLLVSILVAGPWYGLVISETRGAYLAFFQNENANRFLNAMEGHRGPIVYYFGAILAFFAPWCIFLGGSIWYSVRAARRLPSAELTQETRANRFLLCWIGSYLVFFSIAATKLPNYIAPLYPALALLTARYLMLWKAAAVQPPNWVMRVATLAMAVVGGVVVLGLLVMSGQIPLGIKGIRIIPELGKWAFLGGIPIAASVLMGLSLWRERRDLYITIMTAASVLFIAGLAAFPAREVDRYKAPRDLVAASVAGQESREIRLGSLDYTQPSVTFYAKRAVQRLNNAAEASVFLRMPLPAYLFVPEPIWKSQLEGKLRDSYRIVAQKYDFYRNCEILVVSNEAATSNEKGQP